MIPKMLSKSLQPANDKLQKETLRLLENGSFSVSSQKLYKFVEFICRDRYQAKLVNFLYEAIDGYMATRCGQFIDELRILSSDTEILQKFNAFMTIVNAKMKALSKVYLYLDRTYLLTHPSKITIKEYIYEILRVEFMGTPSGLQIANSFVTILNEYRSEYQEETKQLLLTAFSNLKSFCPEDSLIPPLLKRSQTFYDEKRVDLIKHMVDINQPELIFDTMYKVILREVDFWEMMGGNLVMRFKMVVVQYLLFQNFENDAKFVVMPLFQHTKFQSVSALFQFIKYCGEDEKRLGSLASVFLDTWSKYVKEYVTEILKTDLKDKDLIARLFKSKKDLNMICINFLQSDVAAEYKLRDAFEAALTAAENPKSTEINAKLQRYIDSFFRSSKSSKDQDEETLANLIFIFKSVKSKEAFMKDYKRFLAKRLILSTTRDIELERQFIGLLEKEVDSELCNPLYGMFKDIAHSKELKTEYLKTHEPEIDFTPLMLHERIWPAAPPKITLPNELVELLSNFEKFYLSQKQHQLVRWSTAQGSMTLTWNFNSGSKQLEVSTLLGATLLLFNESEKLTSGEIKRKLKLETPALSSVLHSLTTDRNKILLKDEDGYYSINESFQSRQKVIKIKQIEVRKVGDLNDGKDHDCSEDDAKGRKFTLEESLTAFIFRLLKSKRKMRYEDVVKECLNLYIVGIPDIKRSIEYLISQRNIRRDGYDLIEFIP